MYREKLPSGSIRYTERFLDPLTGKKVDVKVTSKKKLSDVDAAALLREKWKSMRSPLIPSSDSTLEDLCAAYLLNKKQTMRPASYNREVSEAKALMQYLGSDTLCSKVTAGMFRGALDNSGQTNGWKNNKRKRWGLIFRWGYKNDYLESVEWLNKIDKYPDTSHREKIQDKFLEREELEALLEGMNVPLWRDLTEFLALSGLRFGEAAALTKKDVNTKERVIHVTKSYSYGARETSVPKTIDSVRDVAMTERLYDLCSRMLKTTYGNTPSVLFVSGKNGQHLVNGSYDKYLKENAKRILGRDHVTAHLLRHTYTSLMAEAGVPLEMISRQLGHSSSKITRDVYLHITKRQKAKDAEFIRRISIL